MGNRPTHPYNSTLPDNGLDCQMQLFIQVVRLRSPEWIGNAPGPARGGGFIAGGAVGLAAGRGGWKAINMPPRMPHPLKISQKILIFTPF
jgi:hypothetical protein